MLVLIYKNNLDHLLTFYILVLLFQKMRQGRRDVNPAAVVFYSCFLLRRKLFLFFHVLLVGSCQSARTCFLVQRWQVVARLLHHLHYAVERN